MKDGPSRRKAGSQRNLRYVSSLDSIVKECLLREAKASRDRHACPDYTPSIDALAAAFCTILEGVAFPVRYQSEYSDLFLKLNSAAISWMKDLGEKPNPFMTNAWAGGVLVEIDNHPSLRTS